MSAKRKCPNCLKVYDDNDVNNAFCSNCGYRLVDDIELDTILNLGDANAISGGVNINRSKNITSHDTHYHSTTVHERSKSDSELKLEAMNQLRSKAEEIIAERGRLDSVAMGQLRPFAIQLGIDDDTFKSIIKDVRSNRNGSSSGLSVANARYLLQAQQAVQTNDMDRLSNLTTRLEAMAAISQDDNVQYLYYLTLSLLYPHRSIEVFEHQTDENYWRSFWAIISYVRTGKHEEATKVIAQFEPLRFEKLEEDLSLLEAYFNIMKEDKDGAQEFLDDILGEPSVPLKAFLRAIEISLYDEDADSLEVRFYYERVLSKSDVVIKPSKKVEAINVTEEVVASSTKDEELSNVTITTVSSEEQPTFENNSPETLSTEACATSGPKCVMQLQKAVDTGCAEAQERLQDEIEVKHLAEEKQCEIFNEKALEPFINDFGYVKNLNSAQIAELKSILQSAPKDNYLVQFHLGQLYIQESNSAVNLKLAYDAIKLASEHGVYEAGAYMAYFYLYGKVVIEDLDEAERRIKLDDDYKKNPIYVQMLIDLYYKKGNTMLVDVWKSKLKKLQ